MLQGFKGFLMRGNVIDLAVAVGPPQVETRACPERTSEILAARRCPQCTAQVSPAG